MATHFAHAPTHRRAGNEEAALTHHLAAGLVLFAGMLLVACSEDRDGEPDFGIDQAETFLDCSGYGPVRVQQFDQDACNARQPFPETSFELSPTNVGWLASIRGYSLRADG